MASVASPTIFNFEGEVLYYGIQISQKVGFVVADKVSLSLIFHSVVLLTEILLSAVALSEDLPSPLQASRPVAG